MRFLDAGRHVVRHNDGMIHHVRELAAVPSQQADCGHVLPFGFLYGGNDVFGIAGSGNPDECVPLTSESFHLPRKDFPKAEVIADGGQI